MSPSWTVAFEGPWRCQTEERCSDETGKEIWEASRKTDGSRLSWGKPGVKHRGSDLYCCYCGHAVEVVLVVVGVGSISGMNS